jgi:hypothetical protein
MSLPSRRRALRLLPLVLVLLAPALPGTPTATAAGEATLRVGPSSYVGGQLITLSGNIGRADVRVKLQGNMGRPGDTWSTIATKRSDSQGAYSFTMPAPSMFGVWRRVVGGGTSTNRVELNPKSQDLVLDVVGSPVAGQPFNVAVHTQPSADFDRDHWAYLKGRKNDLPAPAFPGRTLTLQRQDGAGWTTVQTTQVEADGQGLFEDVVLDQVSTAVLRVRQENIFDGGNRIHWFPSFPTPVQERASARAARTAPLATPVRTTSSGAPTASRRAKGGGQVRQANKRYGWAPKIYDFAWEFGESLTAKPPRGTRQRGRWLDTTTGLGRVSTHNGGLLIDSQRGWGGTDDRGDRGTTTATLKGNNLRYGRWETKMRLKRMESDDRNYRAVIELVPAKARHRRCGARTVTVADVVATGSSTLKRTRVGIAVKGAKRSQHWRAVRRPRLQQTRVNAFAVEIGRRHVSWFVNGRPLGTVKSRVAVPKVPMTMQLRLVGKPGQEMNKTQFHSDWQRGFGLRKGKQVKSGAGLRKRRYSC